MSVSTADLRSNFELRAAAREKLQGNWREPVLVTLIFALIMGLSSVIKGIGPLIVTGPMTLGLVNYYIRLNRGEQAALEDLFTGFRRFVPAFTLHILFAVFVMLWSLLLIVPGIIAAHGYAMAFYIMRDNPGVAALDALRTSKQMMMGHKWQLFMLSLSFIGWWLLCLLTAGIGFLLLVPYVSASHAAFYEDLKHASA